MTKWAIFNSELLVYQRVSIKYMKMIGEKRLSCRYINGSHLSMTSTLICSETLSRFEVSLGSKNMEDELAKEGESCLQACHHRPLFSA